MANVFYNSCSIDCGFRNGGVHSYLCPNYSGSYKYTTTPNTTYDPATLTYTYYDPITQTYKVCTEQGIKRHKIDVSEWDEIRSYTPTPPKVATEYETVKAFFSKDRQVLATILFRFGIFDVDGSIIQPERFTEEEIKQLQRLL